MLSKSELKSRAIGIGWRVVPGHMVAYYEWAELKRREPPLLCLEKFLKLGDHAVDAGSHDGVYARRMAELVGSKGTVTAFEPNPHNISHLVRGLSHFPQIDIEPYALSDREGVATMKIPVLGNKRRDAMATLVSDSIPGSSEAENINVQLKRLDNVLTGLVNLLKIDVEGYELEVLLGSERILRESHPTLIVEAEERHRKNCLTQITTFLMRALGYTQAYALFPNGLRPLSEFDINRDQLNFLNGDQQTIMPKGYVNNFIFVKTNTDLSRGYVHTTSG